MNCLDKVAFLDRDGVINVEVHHLCKIEELKLIDGAREAIKILKDNGFKIVVITNQSVVSRGYLSYQGLHEINQVLNKMVDDMIDGFYSCPHLSTDYCRCRKPQIGLFENAKRSYNIDYDNSYMVGDKRSDILAGYNAGLKTISVKTGYGETSDFADYVVENLLEAVRDVICRQQ